MALQSAFNGFHLPNHEFIHGTHVVNLHIHPSQPPNEFGVGKIKWVENPLSNLKCQAARKTI
jgi:hypothetical protein